MSKALYSPAVLRVIMIGVLIMMTFLNVTAQPTVDEDEAYCQSTKWEEAVNQIRADIKTFWRPSCTTTVENVATTDVQQIKEDVTEVKNLLGSLAPGLHQQPTGAALDETVARRDVQQIKEDLTEVRNFLWSRQQPLGASSSLSECIPTLVQQNVDGSDFFNRSWAEFKVGFNVSRGNYWLGNDLLHQLTMSGHYKLRFDLQASDDGSWYYAKHSSFVVLGEATNYRMHVSGYSGNAGNGFSYHDGMMFTTYDRDNDPWNSPSYINSCAVYNGGGFWYKTCSYANVNTVRGHGRNFRWWANGRNMLLQASRMWLMC